jgi:Ion channel
MRTGGGHRYGAVLVVSLGMATFALATGDSQLARLIELAAAGAALLAALLTSGADQVVRRRAAIAVAAAIAIVMVAVAGGAPGMVLPLAVTSIINAATIAVVLVGLGRLVIERGVGVQAVFGAVAVYVLIGLAFGFLIGAVATAVSGDYFAQGTDGTQSQRVYFSYTAMSTTGFGDLTARTPPGRALAVLEMLVGQLYLVTVIAMLVGNLRHRGERRDHPGG